MALMASGLRDFSHYTEMKGTSAWKLNFKNAQAGFFKIKKEKFLNSFCTVCVHFVYSFYTISVQFLYSFCTVSVLSSALSDFSFLLSQVARAIFLAAKKLVLIS